MPTEWVELFGRPTFFKRIRNISGSFSEDFIKNVPYRVKGVKVDQYIQVSSRESIFNELKSRIELIKNKYADHSSNSLIIGICY